MMLIARLCPASPTRTKRRLWNCSRWHAKKTMDGGNGPEKSYIFGQYKDKINAYLDAHSDG